MDNNIQEEMVTEEATLSETEVRRPRKKFILIGAVAFVVVIAVVLILLFSNPREGKVKIEGKICTYSAEEGIKGIEKACDGIVDFNKGNCIYYPASGEPEEVKVTEVIDGKYPVVYLVASPSYDGQLAITRFSIYGEFETQAGATHKSISSELDKNENMVGAGGYYFTVITEDGAIEWDDIEEDYNKIISSNSFDGIDYIDSAIKLESDEVKELVANDDVSGVVDKFENVYEDENDGKNIMMYWLALGKGMKMLSEGEIDYCVVEQVSCLDFADEDNILTIDIYTSMEDAQKIKDTYGIESGFIY